MWQNGTNILHELKIKILTWSFLQSKWLLVNCYVYFLKKYSNCKRLTPEKKQWLFCLPKCPWSTQHPLPVTVSVYMGATRKHTKIPQFFKDNDCFFSVKERNGHLHSHGRPWPHWSARMSPFGLELHNTNPRIHWNREEVGNAKRSKVTKQSNTSKCVTAIHKPFTHSHYLPSALKLPLTHLSVIVRGTQCQCRPLSQPLTHSEYTHTYIPILVWTFHWLHPFFNFKIELLHWLKQRDKISSCLSDNC